MRWVRAQNEQSLLDCLFIHSHIGASGRSTGHPYLWDGHWLNPTQRAMNIINMSLNASLPPLDSSLSFPMFEYPTFSTLTIFCDTPRHLPTYIVYLNNGQKVDGKRLGIHAQTFNKPVWLSFCHKASTLWDPYNYKPPLSRTDGRSSNMPTDKGMLLINTCSLLTSKAKTILIDNWTSFYSYMSSCFIHFV